MATYALSPAHRNVSIRHCTFPGFLSFTTDSSIQQMEVSLVDSDPEIAQIMVRSA